MPRSRDFSRRAFAALPLLRCGAASGASAGVFAKSNLLAWCIVPFDARQRGPAERAAMLERLGIRMLAYDWRAKDIPTFDLELDELERRRIKLQAFWLSSSLEPKNDRNVETVLGFLERRKVRTEIWHFVSTGKALEGLGQEAKVEAVAKAVGYVAGAARRFGSSVAIYNHGGWSGEPENQAAVIRRLGADNVGIVYNFHHGREHVARFPELLRIMLPHLKAINLNGMKDCGPMILPIGEGDHEAGMIRAIGESGYRGPIGILNHRAEVDAEIGLRQNLDGLRRVLARLGYDAAGGAY